MENYENGWHTSQNGNDTGGPLRDVQVPSSLLPAVMQRLGLPSEQDLSEKSVDELAVDLRSDNWEVRIAAARALGKLDSEAPVELLVPALDDEDGSVRAAAVFALGKVGNRAPLNRLVAALHDPDWHVRETAVLALGKQGQRVPSEALMTALQDTDEAVREAARLALQGHAAEERIPASYGQLWEQKTMQHDKNNIILTNEHTSHETMSYHTTNGGSFEEIGNSEQVQVYAPREDAPGEYYSEASPGWEKVTSFPHRRPQRAWWGVVAVTALLFSLMGGGLALFVMSSVVHTSSGSKSAMPQVKGFPFEKFIQIPPYSSIVQKDVGTGLHLDPKEITARLKSGQSMVDIAAAQGVSASQLATIEMNAFNDVLDNAVSSGAINQQLADQWRQQLQNDPSLLDTITVQAFES